MRLRDVILRDSRASQPAAGDVPIGTLYYVTDENVTERSNGSTWDDYSDTGGGGASAFTDLSDVPASYSSQSLKAVRVNSGETALEFYTPTTVPSVANQTEMEAASSNTVFASPGNTNWHPGVAKGAVLFTTTTTTSITASRNVTSLTDNGTGDTTITWATDFSSGNSYWPCGIAGDDGTNVGTAGLINLEIKCGITVGGAAAILAGSLRVQTVYQNGSGAVDGSAISVLAFGDQ